MPSVQRFVLILNSLIKQDRAFTLSNYRFPMRWEMPVLLQVLGQICFSLFSSFAFSVLVSGDSLIQKQNLKSDWNSSQSSLLPLIQSSKVAKGHYYFSRQPVLKKVCVHVGLPLLSFQFVLVLPSEIIQIIQVFSSFT